MDLPKVSTRRRCDNIQTSFCADIVQLVLCEERPPTAIDRVFVSGYRFHEIWLRSDRTDAE